MQPQAQRMLLQQSPTATNTLPLARPSRKRKVEPGNIYSEKYKKRNRTVAPAHREETRDRGGYTSRGGSDEGVGDTYVLLSAMSHVPVFQPFLPLAVTHLSVGRRGGRGGEGVHYDEGEGVV